MAWVVLSLITAVAFIPFWIIYRYDKHHRMPGHPVRREDGE